MGGIAAGTEYPGGEAGIAGTGVDRCCKTPEKPGIAERGNGAAPARPAGETVRGGATPAGVARGGLPGHADMGNAGVGKAGIPGVRPLKFPIVMLAPFSHVAAENNGHPRHDTIYTGIYEGHFPCTSRRNTAPATQGQTKTGA